MIAVIMIAKILLPALAALSSVAGKSGPTTGSLLSETGRVANQASLYSPDLDMYRLYDDDQQRC
jgi:hypothetical protein